MPSLRNVLWTNHNPRPATICEMCKPFIGMVFVPDVAPPLPAHPGCYCTYFPTAEPPTEWMWDTMPEDTRRAWVRYAAYLLRDGQDLPAVLEPLRDEAEQYNEEREEEEEPPAPPEQEENMTQPTQHPTGSSQSGEPTTGRIKVAFTATGARLQATAGPRRYAVTVIEAGKNKNGWTLPPEILATNLNKFAAAPVQIDHPGFFEWSSLERTGGVIEAPRFEADSVKGYLRLNSTPAGDLLGQILDGWLSDKEAGLEVPDVGLSAVLWLSFDYVEGERICSEIHLVESVDAVLHPAAGGAVERVINSLGVHPPERSTTMPEELSSPEAVAEEAPEGGSNGRQPPQTVSAPAEIDLNAALQSITRVSERIDQLTSDVGRLSTLVADQEAGRTVEGMGDAPRQSIRFGRNSLEQVEEALDAMLEGRHPRDGVQPLTGVRELYVLLSGDYEMTGRFYGDRVYLANVNSSTMAALVANRLNKIVVNTFINYPKWWEPIVTEMDFSTLQDARWITLGGVSTLPTVNEGGGYTELTWDDNTETASFIKKGGYLGLTLEAMDKDDTGRLRLAPLAIAQAAWLALSNDVSAIFTTASGAGPDLADSTALFAGSRGNLGSTALSHAAWVATRTAMRKFAQLHNSARLGVVVAPKFLLVPPDLETTAIQVLATEHTPGSANYNLNPFAEGEGRMARLMSARERVIVVDLWTDTDNWAAVADPMMYPSIAIGYRYGRTPEIFSVASPTAGLMFSNDVMPIKVRYFYATGPVDWRGMYKHNV